jgi:hypothetical protein
MTFSLLTVISPNLNASIFFISRKKKLNIEIRNLKKKCVFVFVTRLVHVFKKWQLIGLPRFLNGLRVDRVTPLQDSRLDQKFFHFPTFI